MTAPARTVQADMPFSDIMTKLRRSWRNGERLHLDREQVLAIIQSPLYAMLAELEAKEVSTTWQSEQSNSGSASSGSHGAPIARSGPSAGMTAPLEPGVESLLAAATITTVLRQSKRKRHSPTISTPTASPKQSTRTSVKASR
ncbi:MAG: hypothetical protein ACT6Q7_02640 [Blastomonas fulva]|uniref:hypothetical protein n=1 Tax=Blastomonas fulva TaxID=1550728 RepID=UPI004033387A